MNGEKLIQVSLQIPPSALDSLSRLAEQLRLLTEAAGTQAISAVRTAETAHTAETRLAAEMERAAGSTFDPSRFQALRQFGDIPAALPPENPDIGDAAEVRHVVREAPEPPETAGSRAAHGQEDDAGSVKEAPAPPAESDEPVPADAVPTVQADISEEIPDARGAQGEAEQQLPEIGSARAEAEKRDLTASPVQSEASSQMGTPLGAGVVIHAQPESPQSRWNGVAEELVVPGPAPLTAEAVSLAFERDGRRYDNGFPLY